jgi:predicted RNase H-like HicB family nuclease
MTQYALPIIIERDADGFFVSCPSLEGCYSEGDTYDQAVSNIKDAIKLHLQDRKADHTDLAEPKSFSLSTVEVSL